jgi:hypothetical protein
MVLGLRKKGAMSRALLGATAEPVICASHVPVLSIPLDVVSAAGHVTAEVHHVRG